MAQRVTKYKACDRCPVGPKMTPAVRTVRFGIGDTFWDLDVCEKHGADLERDLYGWGRLGRLVEVAPLRRFPSRDSDEVRRLGELRSRQVLEDRAAEEARRTEAATGTELLAEESQGSQPAAPEDASEYKFTEHAIERLHERKVRVIDALWAASAPTTVRPARQQGLKIHIRDGVKVVLNPQTKAIITVAITDDNNGKAAAQ